MSLFSKNAEPLYRIESDERMNEALFEREVFSGYAMKRPKEKMSMEKISKGKHRKKNVDEKLVEKSLPMIKMSKN
jgi:hypothetical protein